MENTDRKLFRPDSEHGKCKFWRHIRTQQGPITYLLYYLEYDSSTFWPPHQALVPMLKRILDR